MKKRILALFLVFVMAFSLLPVNAFAADEPVAINKTAVRTGPDTWEITMTVEAKQDDIKPEPLELVLLMDISKSMHAQDVNVTDKDGHTSKAWRSDVAHDAAVGLINGLKDAGVNATVSVMQFGKISDIEANATRKNLLTETSTIINAIPKPGTEGKDGTGYSGGTAIGNATQQAYDLIKAVNTTDNKVIVLLSDGNPMNDTGYGTGKGRKTYETLASELDSGVDIYTIGFMENVAALTTLANGTHGASYTANNANDLTSVFTTIKQKLTAMVTDNVGSDVTINGTGKVEGGGSLVVAEDGKSLTWNPANGEMNSGDEVTITYTVKLNQTAAQIGAAGDNVNLNGTATLNYKVGENGTVQNKQFPIPTATVEVGTLTTYQQLDDTTATQVGDVQSKFVYDGEAFTGTIPTAGSKITVGGVEYTYVNTTDEDGNEVTAIPAVTAGAHTLTHHYTSAKYTVTYEPNGATSGTVPTDPNKYQMNGEATVLGNTGNLAKTGHTFAGWTKDTNVYQAGDKITVTDNVILTAKWTPNQYTVSYMYSGVAPEDAPSRPAGATEDYGTEVTVAQAPTLDGWTFSGWETDDAAVTDGKFVMPDQNVTFTGSWTQDDVTVTYDANGGNNGPESETVAVGSENYPLATAPVPTHADADGEKVVFIGWTAERDTKIYTKNDTAPATIDKLDVVNEDITVYAVWGYDTNGLNGADVLETKYTVTYRDGAADGGAFDEQKYENLLEGEKTPAFNGTPSWTDHTFEGWDPTVAGTVTEDAVYTATWTENEQETFTVTYTDGAEGAAFDDQVYYNCMPNSRTPGYKGIPTREGYEFAGWTPEKAQYVTEDVVYTATWTEKEQETFTVTYTDGAEGAAFDDQVFVNCMPGSRTPGYRGIPTREGYEFAGWTPEKAQYVTEDVVYTATWTEKEQETFTVTYTDGAEGAAFDDQVYYNCMPNSRTPGYKGIPTREGYEFAGWTPEKAPYVTEDAVYTAVWVENEQETFSVTYTDGVNGAAFDDQVYPNCMPNSRTPGYKGTPTREGYTFTGWTPEKATYVTEDAVYTAVWVEKEQETFTVTYTDGAEGAAFDDQVFVNCMPGSRTPGYRGIPTREGYEFAGWTPEKAQYVTEDAVYTAVWVENEQETFSVTYTDGAEGAAFDDQLYPNCMPNSRTPGYKGTPTREGYTFVGWTPEKAQYVTEDAVYTAVWVENEQETFSVTYTDGVGGIAFDDQTYPNCMPNSRTPGYKGTPTREGYTFTGWTPEKATYVTEDAVYTAVWVENEQETFSVTYTDGVGGIAFDDQTYPNCMPNSRTPGYKGTPTREGYTFTGWTPEKATYVTEDAVYTAVWVENEQETFSVTYTDGVNGAAFDDQVYPNCMPNSRTPGYKGTPARRGYTFTGWTPEKATYVTEDAVYVAQWKKDNDHHTGGGSSGGNDKLNTKDHYSYIIGYKDGGLMPYGTITRGEVATIFFRLLTDEARDEYWCTTNSYTDVPETLWCNNAISTLSNMGIIDGYQDGSFRPYGKITRAQFAKMAVGFFETTAKAYKGYFEDVPEDAWFTSYVEAAARVGLINGFEDGTFRPNTNITRAQACVIVNRALDRKPDEEHLLPERKMIMWPDIDEDDWFYADMMEATNSHDYHWIDEKIDGEKVKIEEWTKKLPQRDWAAFENMWADANAAPGGEVVKD